MEEFVIRKSNEKDAESIYAIVSNLLILNKSKENNDFTGFLVNLSEVKEYAERAASLTYTRVLEINNNIVGFIIAFSKEEIENQFQTLNYQKELLCIPLSTKENFLWLDQIGIYPRDYRGLKFGTNLLVSVLEEAHSNGINDYYGSVSLCPWTNIRSIKFLFGFNFDIPSIVYSKQVKWGIFYGKHNNLAIKK